MLILARVPRIHSLLLLAVLVLPGQAVAGDLSEYSAHFRDRTIDLTPFLLGYPYGGARAELEHGYLLYFDDQPEGKWLRRHRVDQTARFALAEGERIGATDWSTRTFAHARYHPPSGQLYLTSDEENDEHLNIYTLNLEDGQIEPVTAGDYIYGWSFSDDDQLLAYLPRAGLQEPLVSTLRIRNLTTGEDREILSDEGGADRFVWSHIAFAPGQDRVILTIQHDGDRKLVSLAQIDLAAPALDYLIEPRVLRYGLELLEDWVSDTELLYRSSESGFSNLYLYDLETRRARQITHYDEDISDARLLGTDPPLVIVAIRRPHETELRLIDARSGYALCREVIAATVDIVAAHAYRGIFSINHLTAPLRLEWFQAVREEGLWNLKRALLSAMPAEVEEQVVHCRTERVTYPTFDRLADGSPRRLHGFYLEPRVPPVDPAERLVLITAFYGGGNRYDQKTHILGAAGIACFSPAPRGSWGFGAEFAALNNHDLGGDEIVDIIYAAKWLVEEAGYAPHQIGVQGGSHGGYATMRTLTFPPETNGRNASFDFGFGISHAGFSDILTFYESCNIPDWVLLEAGDPGTEREKLMERSPINHVARLRAPLLLTHGKNDWRVPVTESRRFVEKARVLGKPVTYVEFPRQGHGIGGLQNRLEYYQAIFDFLEGL